VPLRASHPETLSPFHRAARPRAQGGRYGRDVSQSLPSEILGALLSPGRRPISPYDHLMRPGLLNDFQPSPVNQDCNFSQWLVILRRTGRPSMEKLEAGNSRSGRGRVLEFCERRAL
jgi:hypothetical protein